MANKEDVYITRDGKILRGEEATDELIAEDLKEIIQDAELASRINSSQSKTEKAAEESPLSTENENNLDPPDDIDSTSLVDDIIKKAGPMARIKLKVKELIVPKVPLSAKPAKVNVVKVSGNIVTGSMESNVKLSAEGASVKGACVSGNVLEYDTGVDVGASFSAASVKAANISMKGINALAHASATVTAKGVDIKALNADAIVEDFGAEAEALLSVKGANINAGNAKLTKKQRTVEARALASAEGANISAGNANITGSQDSCVAEAQANATGLDVNVASARVVGKKVHRGVGVSAEAKGLEVKAATANVVGREDKHEVTFEMKAVGAEVKAANVCIQEEKKGVSASAKVRLQGAEVQAASVNVKGKDSSTSAQAELRAGGPSARVANADISPQGGTHFQATADMTPGVDAFNVYVGRHGGGGVGLSTRVQVGNVGLTSGPPNLILGPGFNLGLGGGSSSAGGASKGGNSGGQAGGGPSGGYTTDTSRDTGRVNRREHNGIDTRRLGSTSCYETEHSGQSNRYTPGHEDQETLNGSNTHGYKTRTGGKEGTSTHTSEKFRQSGRYTQNVRTQGSVGRINGGHYESQPIGRENVLGHGSENSGLRVGYSTRDGRTGTNITSNTSDSSNHFSTVGGASSRGTGNIISPNGSSTPTNHYTGSGVYQSSGSMQQTNHTEQSGNPCNSTHPNGSSGPVRFGAAGWQGDATNNRKTNQPLGEKNDTLYGFHTRRVGMIGEHSLRRRVIQTGKESEARKDKSTVNDSHDFTSSAKGEVRSGFGGTHRRSEHTQQSSSPTHKRPSSSHRQPSSDAHSQPSSGAHNNDGSGHTSKGYAWQPRSIDETKTSAQDRDRGRQRNENYGEKLAQSLSKKIERIRPQRPKEKGKPRSSVPSTRKEAVRELKAQMKGMKDAIDSQEREKSPGSESGKSNSASTKGLAGAASTEGDVKEPIVDCVPNEKPFGAQGNIHTLGCFQSNGGKKVKKLSGKVHGFIP